MVKIGVLALQGAVSEHLHHIEKCGAEAVSVKKPEQLDDLDGLILPGGESTTIRKLMLKYGFLEPIRAFAKKGKALFGTCAGMIILAKDIEGDTEEEESLGLMDVKVRRNSFGRQVDSFEAGLDITGLDAPFPAIFIRAPHILSVNDHVEVLSTCDDRIVAVRQGNLLATSFHPELTDDYRMIGLFVDMAREAKVKA
ncbi:pyridoxal 5'-phosphate synthase glutaminase subunit PdxT [Terrilactibacillus sp. BCM23-1]|uniref:Pyridoxal 5'-phosphate synthase subunit PdxT n=1 Tax=Terrilactibacillus tamarindi TaxID=2599694 RepID=A0A6N8CMZ0_9BACI|nr:pyridoxal 5'-phosphate synthase glutaminase subunit PdxT [Terrilactibacillus tamarindi]MTT31301.1 pyridoxal 5'-phosphate synthase glutaminase subunit PdxT [Terrilactibacillus tamarindi]